ncbi:TIM-barrel domain-containing protein [Chitinophagaceae bacterium LWZ2-11]
MKKICLFVLIGIFFLPQNAFCDIITFSKLDDGVLIHLSKTSDKGAKTLKLQVVTENIFRVLASPTDSLFATKSLMVLDTKRITVKWDLKEKEDQLVLSTALVNAVISKTTGSITFTDKYGNIILAEKNMDSKLFTPSIVAGEQLYRLQQVFNSPADEAFYGLGQHQNGIINYKGQQVDLAQNNTEVAIPFVVSSKNYGILWDNYSITKVGDSRLFEQMNTLNLFSETGDEGWLTATYSNKANPKEVFIKRAESSIDYGYIEDLKNLPKDVKLNNCAVTYTGSIQSGFTGIHKFSLKYAGYTKIWIDGKLLADRWRQPWNPCNTLLEVNFSKGKKYDFKIEWIPDGEESYLSCKWLSPAQGQAKNEFAFDAEAGKQIDYYFVCGNNADDVISGYRNLTGKAVMMPKWAMGFWQSRERYKTQDEILNTVSEFRKRKIPLDNIVLDWSYWKENQWGSQEFDETRFADPAAMIKTLHEKYNTHFMISVWPKFYEGIESYNYFNKNGWLYKRNIANQQRDWIAKGYVSTFYDAYNVKARAAFWNLINQKLFSKGIDAWWLDASEPDIYSNINVEDKKSLMTPNALGPSTEYFNSYPLQNAKGIYEGQRETKPDQRVFILTRSAYAGLQHYAAATWSGDIASRWEDLKAQIPAGINFSLSGLPYWTTDIGGFAVENRYEKPNAKDLEEWRELTTRWYQFGAFCPLFRSHGQFPYREIYNIAPEDHPAYQSMLYYDQLRYRLMPYIYSLVGNTYVNNSTIMRGLIMDFNSDTAVRNIGDQFMFGPAILVNPVTDYKATQRSIYLPATTGWYNFYTGKYYAGGQHINVDAPLKILPLFIKEGSVIPMGPALQYTAEKQADTITLMIYTGKDASFNLYEDENTNYNYEQGAFSNIVFNYNEAAQTITVEDRKGTFPGMLQERVFNIIWIKKGEEKALDLNNTSTISIKYKGRKITVKMK